jgi:hypothetical protein
MFKKQYFIAAAFLIWGAAAQAQNLTQFEVTITNITQGQSFTPQLVVAHNRSTRLFELGEQASPALALLAEDGQTGSLQDELANATREATEIAGLLEPGQSATTVIGARRGDRLSVAAMLIPTNDTFMALNGASLPWARRSAVNVHLVPAYDAGTEANDQDCANIPGPRCGGVGSSPEPAEGDEGFIHVSNGFHFLGDGEGILGPEVYDWRNPVARVVVTRRR